MISIPLRDVVAFLRQHNALGVLDGAPYVEPASPCPLDLRALQAVEDATADAQLYLGKSELCPAAEGWALVVLALARSRETAGMIEEDGRITLWTSGVEEYDYRWGWSEGEPEPFEGGDFTLLPGPPPPTPAERLAAVLRYELERAR